MHDDRYWTNLRAHHAEQRARELTPGEETSLVKIAEYRALVGRQQATIRKQSGRIRQLEALLRDLRDQTAPASSAAQMIDRGLEEWPEEAA